MNPSRKALPDFTKGPITKTLISLSVPIVFANILQTAYQLTDTFWVGRLGKEAVAAVSLSFPIIFLLISLGGGLSIAGTILVAQYRGQQDTKQIDHVSAQTLISMIIMSIIVSIVGYYISAPIMKFMGAAPEVLPGAVSYMKISFVGLVFMFSYFVFQSLMRGVGDVKTPMYIVLGTVLLNLILDPLFIMGYGPIPALGISGAALATVGTQGIAAIVGFIMLFSGKYGIHLKKEHLMFDWPLIKKMFFLGLPASIDQSTRALGLTVLSFLVASFGTVTVAAYGIGIRIFSFVIIPALGLSIATSTLVGQNMGAGKIKRAEKIAQKSSLFSWVLLTGVGIIIFLCAHPIVRVFIPGETETIISAVQYIRYMALTFGFIGIQQTINGVFTGSGNTTTTMIISIVSLWVFQFPLAYVLSKHTGLAEVGIWIAFPVSNVLSSIMAYILFKKGAWKQKKLIPDTTIEKQVFTETKVEEGLQ